MKHILIAALLLAATACGVPDEPLHDLGEPCDYEGQRSCAPDGDRLLRCDAGRWIQLARCSTRGAMTCEIEQYERPDGLPPYADCAERQAR